MTLVEQLAASTREDARVRPVAGALLGLVLCAAFLLRFDAAIATHGTATAVPISEHAQLAVQGFAASLRPAAVNWQPAARPYEGGDPASYLYRARRMEQFYAADRREPLYVASVKLGLWLFRDQDVGITYTSLLYSVLLVWATYLLGAYAFCRWVGLAAAALIAGEFEIIRWSVEGWRDDAFSFFFVLSTFASLRLTTAPSLASGCRAGVVAGLALLTRITSLSFVLPAFVCALFPWLCGRLTTHGAVEADGNRRRRAVGAAVLLSLALVGPFLLNCWLEHGDPLYAINAHTQFYRDRAGIESEEPMSVSAYLAMRARDAPVEVVDTALNGVTTYPFGNKWRGLAPWWPALPALLARLSLLGLAMFLWSPGGRYVLLMGLASMAPYAFTWRIAGGDEWRFTMHVYALLALAAFWAVDRTARFAARLSAEDFRFEPAQQRLLLRRGLVTGLLVLALAVTLRELPHWKRLEDLRAGRPVHIRAGQGDTRYFVLGWHAPAEGANVTARYSSAADAMIRIPLIAGRDHVLTVRLQPYHDPTAPPQRVRVTLNGELLTELTLEWDPNRVGSYEVEVPARLARPGMNRLGLEGSARFRAGGESTNPLAVAGAEVGFFVWYVNVTARDFAPTGGTG